MRVLLQRRAARSVAGGPACILVLLVGLGVAYVVATPDPLDVPLYPQAGRVDLPQYSGAYLAQRVVLETPASPATVQAYYYDRLCAAGWNVRAAGNRSPDPH